MKSSDRYSLYRIAVGKTSLFFAFQTVYFRSNKKILVFIFKLLKVVDSQIL